MPTVDKVTVSYGVTLNADNYESVRYGESVEASLVNDDKAGEVLDELKAYVKDRVDTNGAQLLKEFKAARGR